MAGGPELVQENKELGREVNLLQRQNEELKGLLESQGVRERQSADLGHENLLLVQDL